MAASARYLFCGSTISAVDSHNMPNVNRWCELISIRLYDHAGKDLCPIAKISWAQRPQGNQDTSALFNGRIWPSQDFAVWDTENGDMHNGMRLVEIIFDHPTVISRGVVLTTNCESFGTNPRIERYNGQSFVKHLTTTPQGGLTVKYVAANSPISSFPHKTPPVSKDGEEVAVVEALVIPGMSEDDRSFTGQDGTSWEWDTNALNYVRCQPVSQPKPQGGGQQKFCVQCGTEFIGKFCAVDGAKRDKLHIPAATAPSASAPIVAVLVQPAPMESPQVQLDESINFIEGVNYSQIDLDSFAKNKPIPWLVDYGVRLSKERGVSGGFFFQQHTNGHEIIGFYENTAAMQGKRVRHGHRRGFVVTLCAAADPPIVHAVRVGGESAISLASLFVSKYCVFRSLNYPKHSWKVESNEKITIAKSGMYSPHGFDIVAGLTGEVNTVSFRASSGNYLRHCGYLLRCHRDDGSELFRKDSSFKVKPSLAGTQGHFSFQSVNFPHMHIGHRSYILRICESNGSDLHRKDASFQIMPK